MSGQDPKQQLTRPFLHVYGDEVTGKKRSTNYIETLIHMIKGYVGTGIFAMGAGFLNSGLLFGPILLVAVALLCLHCQHILVRANVAIASKEVVEVLPSYAETVQYTFEDSSSVRFKKYARAASITTTVFLLICEYGTDVVYLIFVSTHIKEFADGFHWEVDYRIWLAILIVPIWLPTLLSNLKFLVPISLIANILLWAGIAIVIYYTSQDLSPIKDRHLVANIVHWPKFVGISFFAFMGITFILNLRMEMKNRDQFLAPLGVLNVSMFIVVLLYFIIGFMVYWKYGECVKGSAFLNLPADQILSQITQVGIAVAIIFSYTLHMYIPFEILYPIFFQKYGPFKRPVLIMNLYRTFWVVVTYIFANIDNRLDSVIGLVGGITGAVVTMILPALIELAMLFGNLKVWTVIKNVCIIIVAIFAAVTATVLSAIDIIKHIKGTEQEEDTC